MQENSNVKIIKIVSRLLILLLIAKSLSLLLWWYLPSEGVELNAEKSYAIPYQRVNFKNMITKTTKSTTVETTKVKTVSYSIQDLILKGLYGNSKNGFAIVSKKSSQKTTDIVKIGEVYSGYTLKDIKIDQVIFTKNNKEYVLKLKEGKKLPANTLQKVKKSAVNASASQHDVKKSDITYYSKNPSQIWKDIAIREVKVNGKINGFKVNRIKANSKMAELGLLKGDIILKANNVELKSYKDAMKLYQNIDKIDAIELLIKRNNQEKEIVYEIH